MAALMEPLNAEPNALMIPAVCVDETMTKAIATDTIPAKMSKILPKLMVFSLARKQ